MTTTISNIKFRKHNMSIKDHYFYMFDDEADLLIQKVDDGAVSFSYPLDTSLVNEIVDSEFDGVNFWTLENTNPNVIIKRWLIENYTCKLKDTFDFVADVGHSYNVESFSVENYCLTISGTYIPGDKIIYVTPGYSDRLNNTMTVTLGPNNHGYTETISVSSSEDGKVTLADEITQTYNSGDNFRFYNNLFLFNNFDGKDDTSSALYKVNAYSGGFIIKYTGGEYRDVTASKFVTTDNFIEYGTINSLAFAKGANILFVNIEQLGTLSEIYRSMVADNLITSNGAVIPILDMDIVDDNIFKLQATGCKFGESVTFVSGANYMLEPFDSFLTSILMYTNPGVIPANNIAVTTLTARVTDQYGLPIGGKHVHFYPDSEVSYAPVYITGDNPANTDVNGNATTIVRAGTYAGWSKIVAYVEQS